MADNAAQLTNTLFYHARLIRRADSAISDDTSAGNLGGTQSSQFETSTPSSVSSSSSTETASISSSSSNSPASSQTTSSSTSTTRQPVITSSPPSQHSGPSSVQQNTRTDSPPPTVINSPPNGGGLVAPLPPPDVSQDTTSVSVTDTSSKVVVDVSSSVSSPSLTHGTTSSLTRMISVPSDSVTGGDTTTGSNALVPTVGSQINTVPIIIGSVLGGVALILMLSLLFFLRQRRRRRQEMETLRWETVHDPADEPQSPLSSDLGHGLIETRVIPNNLDGHVRQHWTNSAYGNGPGYLEPSQAHSRGNSPGGASTVSTISSVTFARPAVSQGTSQVTPTGHYTPSSSEDGHVFNESWLTQSRKTRPSLMTFVSK